MDSGNSGSMQSSSGGDDQEFHSSRASDSISSFFNSHNNNNNNTFTPQQNFLTQNNQNPFFNTQTLDDHNPFPLTTHYNTNPINWSSSTTNTTTSTSNNLRSHSQVPQTYTNLTTPSSSSTQQPILPTTQTLFSNPRSDHEQLSNVIKNPKKRTRASRRAPTTVLTTDTTNFRQMVQEFTGIPPVPFSGSPYARRLDIFSSGLRPDSFGPIYPLRPAAHKYNSTSSTPMFATTNTSLLDTTTTTNNNHNFSLASADQLLNQFQQNQNISLQNLMSGYPSQEQASNDGRNNNRWRNNSNDGVQENNMVLQQFDGNRRIGNGGNENVQLQEHHVMSGGYNLNVVSEKNVGDHQGNVAAAASSWICNSD